MHNKSIEYHDFFYHEEQRANYRKNQLGIVWADRYPQLFDVDDSRLRDSQCETYHFFEWLAAILIYESTGYLSLVEKYWSKKHPRKLPIWERVAPLAVRELDHDSGWPDLFVYSPDESDWFFCETKAADKISPEQFNCFRDLYRVSGQPVRVIHFHPFKA